MFGFLRNLFALFGLLVLVGGAIATYYYGTVDPCRILAAKRSQETISGVSEAFGGDGESLGSVDDVVERTFRALTSQYSMEECGTQLASEWWGQLMAKESGMVPSQGDMAPTPDAPDDITTDGGDEINNG